MVLHYSVPAVLLITNVFVTVRNRITNAMYVYRVRRLHT